MLYLIISLFCIVFFSGCSQVGHEQQRKNASLGLKRIAIMTPVSHPALEQIQDGFIKTLSQSNKYEYVCDVFNANGKDTLLRSQAEEVARGAYDLVFTIGARATCVTQEIVAKRGAALPLVFGAVEDPVGLGIITSERNPGGCVTGVIEMVDYQKMIDVLFTYKPEIKRALLVYNPTQGAGLEKYKAFITSLLREKESTVTSVQVFSAHEIQSKVESFIEGHDVVIVLKDNTVVQAMPCLAKLCKRYGVTLCASDLDSFDHGADFCFGVHERDFGIAAALKAQLILEKGVNPGNIPAEGVQDYHVLTHLKQKKE